MRTGPPGGMDASGPFRMDRKKKDYNLQLAKTNYAEV